VHPIWQNNQLVDGGHYQAEAEVSGQYGVILPANFLEEKEEMKLKVYKAKST
jgi:hypothetical protein